MCCSIVGRKSASTSCSPGEMGHTLVWFTSSPDGCGCCCLSGTPASEDFGCRLNQLHPIKEDWRVFATLCLSYAAVLSICRSLTSLSSDFDFTSSLSVGVSPPAASPGSDAYIIPDGGGGGRSWASGAGEGKGATDSCVIDRWEVLKEGPLYIVT